MKIRCLARMLLLSSVLASVSAYAATEINYWLWDNNQLPSYQACAEAFEKANPDIKIKITQTGWFDYCTALNTAPPTSPDIGAQITGLSAKRGTMRSDRMTSIFG